MVLDTWTHLSLKAGANVAGDRDIAGVESWIAMVVNKWTLTGLLVYVLELFLWFWFLSMVPLSQAVLVACFDIFLIALGGRIFFKEHLSANRVMAISLVAAGVALVGWTP